LLNLSGAFKPHSLPTDSGEEPHFLPQNVPRYQSMLALFRGASMRMEALLRRVHPQTSAEDRRRALHSVHALLEDLGAEALVENAEWLKMHRISPPTPLMPSP